MLLLLGHTVQLHRRLSDEITEIVPIARAIPPNSDIRRVLYDARSRWLDPRYFPAIRYRPAYAEYQGYHGLLHEIGIAGRYDFLIVRGLPLEQRSPGHDLVLRSGSWTLLRPRTG